MIGLKRLWGSNKLAREKMVVAHSGFAAVASQIRAAQHKYLVGPRVPSSLKPLKIDDSTADWIREKYKTAPKSLSLDWIKAARDEHDLVICPMCGGTTVATLEHVLPKADYPEFAVLSFNLVPCCDGCQKRRSNKGKQYEFIHPYFDHDLLASLRLVVHFTPPYDGVIFKLSPQGVVGNDLLRTQKHLDESVPPLLFRRHLKNLWTKWHKRSHKLGALVAQQRLSEDLLDVDVQALNSWEAAFLRGLLQDTAALLWMELTQP